MKIIKLFTAFFLFPMLSGNISAQISSDWKRDAEISENFFQSIQKNTVDSNIVSAALFFLNTPYIANTLDVFDTEDLVVNFREMDCMSFVENCLALSRTLQYPNPDMEYFQRELQLIRYRNGIINAYTSRLHYTSDWIFDNIKKGILEDKTIALSGKKIKFDLHFMSENYQKYKHLKNNPEAVTTIKEIEQNINRRSNYFFLPKQEIKEHQSLIKDGDIICFTTSIAGLDISHLGIAYRHRGQLSFIHASSTAKKVIINPESLVDYCTKIKSNTGIIVLHPSSRNE
jgi:hypothetical protein